VTHPFRLVTVVTAVLIGLMVSSANAQTPVATYFFSSSLAAQEGGAPALSPIDPLGLNGFETATVFGEQRTVYRWNGNALTPSEQAGFVVNTTGLLTPNNYSVEIVFEFTEENNSWRRIMDTQNRQSDNGFYVEPSDRLQVYNSVTGTTIFPTNVFQHVVLTNFFNGGGQSVTGYLNGILEMVSDTDQLNLDNVNNPDRLLHFFVDNNAGPAQTEFADGRIAMLRLWEGVLTPAQVAAQSRNPFVSGGGGNVTAPEPGTLVLLLPGMVGIFAVARRKRSH